MILNWQRKWLKEGRTMKITKANGVVEYQLLAQLKQRAGEDGSQDHRGGDHHYQWCKEGGDEAVREYTVRFDGSVPKKIEFDKDEIHAFLDQVDPAFKDAVVKAQQNIYDFHQRQAQQSWMTTKESGVIMGQRIRGLKRVGIYVRWHRGVSLLCADERRSRQDRRCTGNYYGDPARQGRQSQSQHYGGGCGGRCG